MAANEEHLVFEGSVGADLAGGGFGGELGDEGPFVGAGGVGEEGLEGGGGCALVEDVLGLEFGEGGVAGGDVFLVGGFGFGGHGALGFSEGRIAGDRYGGKGGEDFTGWKPVLRSGVCGVGLEFVSPVSNRACGGEADGPDATMD
jgi:hypothetical protein